MINISKLPAPLWVAAVGCFFMLISIIIFPFVVFKVHRDIEKKYRVIINYPSFTYTIGILSEYGFLAMHVCTFYVYSISNSKLLKKFLLKGFISYSFLTEFNYNVKEEKKSNLIICVALSSSLFLCVVLMTCAAFMISPTFIFD